MSTLVVKATHHLAAALAFSLSWAGLAAAQEQALPATERPLAPEVSPPGDIPDNQLFIDYVSPSGVTIKVPEGWARRDLPNGAEFTDKYSHVRLTEEPAAAAPDVAMAQATLVPQIQAEGRAVEVTTVEAVQLPAGPALRARYGSNSDPNPVTDKAVRLESDRYYVWRSGTLAILDLAAPAGADNVDQWTLMASSVSWN